MFEPSRAQVGDETKLPREEEKDQKIKQNQKRKSKTNQRKSQNPPKWEKSGKKALAVTSQ
jgi:hypothetical protein